MVNSSLARVKTLLCLVQNEKWIHPLTPVITRCTIAENAGIAPRTSTKDGQDVPREILIPASILFHATTMTILQYSEPEFLPRSPIENSDTVISLCDFQSYQAGSPLFMGISAPFPSRNAPLRAHAPPRAARSRAAPLHVAAAGRRKSAQPTDINP